MLPAMEPHPVSTSQQIAAIRRFNRFYTSTIGTLEEGLLKSALSLAEARVLYEIASRNQPTASEIANELNLDMGYLSRILRTFTARKLISRKTSSSDGRQTLLSLTPAGRKEFAALDGRSSQQVQQMIEHLNANQQRQLIGSMSSIESLLNPTATAASSQPYILRSHRAGDMGWIVERHGALYAQEYGWNEHFEALVARIVADFITGYKPKRERCWIAERDGERLGCIFLVKHPEQADVAKLRLLLVEPSARGLGLGKALVNECVSFARTAGYKKITLWTQSILTSAHHIYQQAGFKLVHEAPHHSFGVDLIEQTWDLKLNGR
ncbi:GNAT family N-acetyltransferase [Edaphobacter dinghuensis]|uniref:GNAT family N-acetyltransferase n=2 Tax=Edaphobacter dinghuensis TaxID=1560005 RepID=A0A917H8C5_9BACT|nr:GNAT family N-acetyltransferase [Edaphobacter dinghuensis]